MILSSLLTGVTGDTDVFSSFGKNVSLPCNNALHDCTSTTWNYNKYRTSAAVELIAGGQKKNNIERRERLSLGSDCSLNIYKTTEEDHGQYNCQQYVNGHKHGTDANVLLHVLIVSSSSAQTAMRSGSSVTLSCQLFSYENSCDTLVSTEGIQLVWVNQAGVNLHTDSRYQILSQGHCISTLTTKLLNEDNNTELKCLLKKKNEIKTSANYTVKLGDINTSFEDNSTSDTSTVIVICAVIAALAGVLAAAVLWMFCKKRADNKGGSYSSVVLDKTDHKDTYETIHISSLPTPSTDEQTNDVTYCEVTASSKQQVIKSNVPCDDKVTYATIK